MVTSILRIIPKSTAAGLSSRSAAAAPGAESPHKIHAGLPVRRPIKLLKWTEALRRFKHFPMLSC